MNNSENISKIMYHMTLRLCLHAVGSPVPSDELSWAALMGAARGASPVILIRFCRMTASSPDSESKAPVAH